MESLFLVRSLFPWGYRLPVRLVGAFAAEAQSQQGAEQAASATIIGGQTETQEGLDERRYGWF